MQSIGTETISNNFTSTTEHLEEVVESPLQSSLPPKTASDGCATTTTDMMHASTETAAMPQEQIAEKSNPLEASINHHSTSEGITNWFELMATPVESISLICDILFFKYLSNVVSKCIVLYIAIIVR